MEQNKILVTGTKIEQAVRAIEGSKYLIAFTGAGISVESGIPSFRGSADSVWNNYDPSLLQIDVFLSRPKEAWPCVREVFYKYVSDSKVQPNKAHEVLAKLEAKGLLKCVVTQNVDDLHQRAGTKKIFPFHGSVDTFECISCHHVENLSDMTLDNNPPMCPRCGKLMKPGFVFFGEGIPRDAYNGSFAAAEKADVCLVVGTTGEVMPACMVPSVAKQHGATVIEINPNKSALTDRVTDVFIPMKAGEAFAEIEKLLKL